MGPAGVPEAEWKCVLESIDILADHPQGLSLSKGDYCREASPPRCGEEAGSGCVFAVAPKGGKRFSEGDDIKFVWPLAG